MCKINWNREFDRDELMLKFYVILVITLRAFVNKILTILVELEALNSEIHGRSSCIFLVLNKAIWLNWFWKLEFVWKHKSLFRPPIKNTTRLLLL